MPDGTAYDEVVASAIARVQAALAERFRLQRSFTELSLQDAAVSDRVAVGQQLVRSAQPLLDAVRHLEAMLKVPLRSESRSFLLLHQSLATGVAACVGVLSDAFESDGFGWRIDSWPTLLRLGELIDTFEAGLGRSASSPEDLRRV